MRYLAMFGVFILLVVGKSILDVFMGWKSGGGALGGSLYMLFASSIFMAIFRNKNKENSHKQLKIYIYIAVFSAIALLVLYSQKTSKQYKPLQTVTTQAQNDIDAYNIAFKEKLWEEHPELSSLKKEEQSALMANMKKWIEAKPYNEAKELLKIFENGNAEQVSWLMSEYKKVHRIGEKPVAIALPIQEGERITGERVRENNYWYSSVIKSRKSNLYLCGTNSGFVDDNSQVMLIVMPQIFQEGDVLSIYVQKTKFNADLKNGFCLIDFGNGIKSFTTYAVEDSDSQLDMRHVFVRHYNVRKLIDLMMKHNNMNITFEGQNISLTFSLSGFTASLKRLLKLSQELK